MVTSIRGGLMVKRTAFALILSTVLFLPAQGQSDTEREPSTLTVSGRGEVRVAPDETTVRLGVSRQRETAQEAQEEFNQVAQEILAAVIQLGVKAEQIQTSELRLSPVYSTRRPGPSEEPRVVAYRDSNMVSVRLEDLSLVGPTIDSAMEAGANQLQGVNFDFATTLLPDRKHLKKRLRKPLRKPRQSPRLWT